MSDESLIHDNAKLQENLHDARHENTRLLSEIRDLKEAICILETALEDAKKTARYKAHSAEKFALMQKIAELTAQVQQ